MKEIDFYDDYRRSHRKLLNIFGYVEFLVLTLPLVVTNHLRYCKQSYENDNTTNYYNNSSTNLVRVIHPLGRKV